jgi:hypothetical protein
MKRDELSRHRGYTDDLTHGFVTLNVKYQPDTISSCKSEVKRTYSIGQQLHVASTSTEIVGDNENKIDEQRLPCSSM